MASAVNLVPNPSFETNITGWTTSGVTPSQDTVPNVTYGTGVGSLKCVATGGSVGSASVSISGLTVGTNYTVSFFSKIMSVTTDFSLVADINGFHVPSKPLRSSDPFLRRFIGFTATATSASISILSETVLSANDTFWIDRVMVNAGGLLPYFDGSYPFSSWSGTPFASTSLNSAFDPTVVGTLTTEEVVIVNGLALNNLAWNITTKSDRSVVPSSRGDNLVVPGIRGRTFIPNKAVDSGLYTLSMFVLGAYPDGSVPLFGAQRIIFTKNFERIMRQTFNSSTPVDMYVWHPSGGVRHATGTLAGSSTLDATMTMGGRRAEISLAFEILSGVWEDVVYTTVTGVASSGWSSQSLSLVALSDGTAVIDDSVITVTGPITNPVISNAATSTSVTLTGNVPAGQTWVVDCGQWFSTVNGISVLSTTTHLGHPRFVLIDPGNMAAPPSLTLTGTNTSSATNLSVTAKRKHLIS